MQGQLVQTSNINNRENDGASWILIALIALALGTAFFVSEVDWHISTYENYSLEADDAEALVATGSNTRKAIYATIGLLGGLLLLAASRQPRRLANPTMMFLATYVVMCCASIAWSDDPILSIKRVAVLGFCILGAIGVAKHLNALDLLKLTVVIAFFLVGMGVCTELALGTFKPFNGNYRFAGTVHPNTQGAYCAVLAIAGFFGAKGPTRGRFVYLAALALGIGLLLLTKSRASCAGCLFALSAAWLLSSGRVARTFACVGGPLAVCLILIASLLAGMEVTSELDRAARLGRSELESSVAGLNGRVPLWTHLMSHVSERPLLGYGYNGFWTPQRIYEISSEHEWTIATAHSVVIDVLLSVGMIGGLLFGITFAMTLYQAGRRCLQTHAAGDTYVFALAMFAIVSGVFESGFAQPAGFDTFVVACGLFYVVMLRERCVADPSQPGNIAATRCHPLPVPYGVGSS